MDIRNPVRIRALDAPNAQALAVYVRSCGAPAEVEGLDVIVPGDQPGFFFSVAEHALDAEYASDDSLSAAIRRMEAGLS